MGSLTFHTPDALEKRIREAATADKRTLSNWLRIAIEERLDSDDATETKVDKEKK